MKMPKYIEDLLKRVYLAPAEEQVNDVYGYTYRLYGKYLYGRNVTLKADTEKLCKWARRHFAEAKYIDWIIFETKDHRKGKKDYTLFTMTDPVANKLEKLGLLKR